MDVGALRSPPVRGLILAALAVPLALAPLVIAVQRGDDGGGVGVEAGRPPDDRRVAQEEVLAAARAFVVTGRLQNTTASYALMPCAAEAGPPYQGSAYVNFDVPGIAETPGFFAAMLDGMIARGWTGGVRPNDHPGGRTLGRDGLSAVYYRNPEVPGRGVLQIYGRCAVLTEADVTEDPTAFVDVTARLGK